MHRQFTLILVLAAWLLATGSQWELVQTVGWARMIATYSRSMPLRQAVQKTFSGDDLCGMCKLVQGAKQSEDANGAKVPGLKLPEKIFVPSTPAVLVFASPVRHCDGVIPDVAALLGADRAAPPGPPPRLAA